MNIQAEKLKLIQMLIGTDNPRLIEQIASLFQSENLEKEEDLSNEELELLEIAIKQSENGEIVKFEDFLAIHK